MRRTFFAFLGLLPLVYLIPVAPLAFAQGNLANEVIDLCGVSLRESPGGRLLSGVGDVSGQFLLVQPLEFRGVLWWEVAEAGNGATMLPLGEGGWIPEPALLRSCTAYDDRRINDNGSIEEATQITETPRPPRLGLLILGVYSLAAVTIIAVFAPYFFTRLRSNRVSIDSTSSKGYKKGIVAEFLRKAFQPVKDLFSPEPKARYQTKQGQLIIDKVVSTSKLSSTEGVSHVDPDKPPIPDAIKKATLDRITDPLIRAALEANIEQINSEWESQRVKNRNIPKESG